MKKERERDARGMDMHYNISTYILTEFIHSPFTCKLHMHADHHRCKCTQILIILPIMPMLHRMSEHVLWNTKWHDDSWKTKELNYWKYYKKKKEFNCRVSILVIDVTAWVALSRGAFLYPLLNPYRASTKLTKLKYKNKDKPSEQISLN